MELMAQGILILDEAQLIKLTMLRRLIKMGLISYLGFCKIMGSMQDRLIGVSLSRYEYKVDADHEGQD